MADRLTARGRDGEGHLIVHDLIALEPGEDADAVFTDWQASLDDQERE
ncbi:hypothetical protein [Actinomycetospora flava]|uniref:Uncharacterized protein n=1 Tax=Actinomycetospora flava TaxID=3129232 RepID=A0ABU8MGA3_9PSEU